MKVSGTGTASNRCNAKTIFTAQRVKQIREALPKDCEHQKLNCLSALLRDWEHTSLREHRAREPHSVLRARDDKQRAVIEAAGALARAWDALDKHDRFSVALRMSGWPTKDVYALGPNDPHSDEAFLREVVCPSIAKLAEADRRKATTLSRGQPRNLVAYLIMLDLGNIFEFLTKKRPTRIVGNKDSGAAGREVGEFADFVRPVWEAIWGSDAGMSAAIKNWSQVRASLECNESSEFMANYHNRMGLGRAHGE